MQTKRVTDARTLRRIGWNRMFVLQAFSNMESMVSPSLGSDQAVDFIESEVLVPSLPMMSERVAPWKLTSNKGKNHVRRSCQSPPKSNSGPRRLQERGFVSPILPIFSLERVLDLQSTDGFVHRMLNQPIANGGIGCRLSSMLRAQDLLRNPRTSRPELCEANPDVIHDHVMGKRHRIDSGAVGDLEPRHLAGGFHSAASQHEHLITAALVRTDSPQLLCILELFDSPIRLAPVNALEEPGLDHFHRRHLLFIEKCQNPEVPLL